MTTEKITDSTEIILSPEQAAIQIINANVTYCAWPRAGGKTTRGIAPRLMELSEVMPRCQIILFSDTYERLLSILIPNIIHFWESKLFWTEGIDFIRFKQPPDEWEKPLIKPDKYDRVISLSNGTAICLVSLHVEGCANGYNAAAAIGDEVKFCDEEKITAEVMPALRGNEDLYGHLPQYLSIWMFTDKWGPKLKWFLKKKKLMNMKAVEVVYVLQMKILQLQNEIRNCNNDESIKKSNNQIMIITKKLDRIRKNLIYFSDMKPYENKPFVGEFFFKRGRKIAKSEYMYNVAYLNHDPDKIEHTFYPCLTDENIYELKEGESDYDPMLPFIGAMDYNYRIAPLPIVQISKLEMFSFKSLNVIDYLYELFPKGAEDVVASFCKKYEKHENKKFHFIYDHTAIGRSTSKKLYKDIVVDAFKLHGWIVVEHYIGKAPGHDIKFERIKKWMLHRLEKRLMFNKITTGTLLSALWQSPAITSKGITEKDKKTEKDISFPAEDSTHGPDALDTILWGIYEISIDYKSTTPSLPIFTGK